MRFFLPIVLFGGGALIATCPRAANAQSAPAIAGTQTKLESMAARVTHFATLDIIRNRDPDNRMPATLFTEQMQLPGALRAMGGEQDALRSLLKHPNPKVRTLALGALFEREDPKDLPAIASLIGDTAATFPLLHMAATSQAGKLPLADFESAQTVGAVAGEMIFFYLTAAKIEVPGARSDPFALTLVESGGLAKAFQIYWTARSSRDRCASWFLVKFERASRNSDPVLPEHKDDVDRLLATIRTLPPVERAWTELYLWSGAFSGTVFGSGYTTQPLFEENDRVAIVKAAGSDALLRFLQRRPVTDDPDLQFDDNAIRSVFAKDQFLAMAKFILKHSRELLRPEDADPIAALANAQPQKAQGDTAIWLSTAAALKAPPHPNPAPK